MKVPFMVAWRYLFARKSHNVINIISLVSSIGMALGTAALVVIMSVYNGFEGIVSEMMESYECDLVIEPVKGKKFIPEGSAYDWMYSNDAIASFSYSVTENVFLSYEGRQRIVKAKGLDSIAEEESPVGSKVIRGDFYLHRGEIPYACVGAGVAADLGINPRFLSPMTFYYPDPQANISLVAPESSLKSFRCYPSSIFSISSDIDAATVIVPVEYLQELLGYSPSEFSSVDITLVEGLSSIQVERLKDQLSELLGTDFKVLDRTMQNPTLYKMLRYEKAAIYLILIFVVIIIAFNIFGSLSMLIIDKKDDMATLSSLGMESRDIRRIFILEGWMISLLGLFSGLILGIILTLVQQWTGLIKMPSAMMTKAYPVSLQAFDVILAMVIIALIGYLISLLASRKARF